MKKYTAEQVRDWLAGKERAHACYQHWSVSLDEEMVRGFKDAIDALLRERESAKAGVTDEMVCRADVAQREFFESTLFIGDSDRLTHNSVRAALEAVAPMLASARVPDDIQKDAERWRYLVRENNKGMHGKFRICWIEPGDDGFTTTDGVSVDGRDDGAIVRIIDKALLAAAPKSEKE